MMMSGGMVNGGMGNNMQGRPEGGDKRNELQRDGSALTTTATPQQTYCTYRKKMSKNEFSNKHHNGKDEFSNKYQYSKDEFSKKCQYR
jgi:hypothetical protein